MTIEREIETIEETPVTTTKVKRPYEMTPARQAALERMKEGRRLKAEASKKAKSEQAEPEVKPKVAPQKRKGRRQVIVLQDGSSSSSEEENKIVIRRKSKKKVRSHQLLNPVHLNLSRNLSPKLVLLRRRMMFLHLLEYALFAGYREAVEILVKCVLLLGVH